MTGGSNIQFDYVGYFLFCCLHADTAVTIKRLHSP